MAKFIFAYHGGSIPQTEEEQQASMAAWGAWMQANAAALVDPGAPVGKSVTVSPEGVADNGGANPLSGYTIIEADTLDAAIAIAQANPILPDGGSVEVAPLMEM